MCVRFVCVCVCVSVCQCVRVHEHKISRYDIALHYTIEHTTPRQNIT